MDTEAPNNNSSATNSSAAVSFRPSFNEEVEPNAQSSLDLPLDYIQEASTIVNSSNGNTGFTVIK